MDSIEDEDEIQFLSSESVFNRFSGEDLCERAVIERRNGYKETSIPLNDYNNGFVEHLINSDQRRAESHDYEIESIIQSVMDSRLEMESNYSSDSKSDTDSVEIIEDSAERSKWTPNVFLAPKEDIHYFDCDFKIDFDEYLDQLLKYTSNGIPPPGAYDSCQKAFGFNKSFLERLKRLECQKVNLELHLWPPIVKGYSICCISGPKTGKTTSYLIPLLNWFDSSEVQHLKDEIKIGAIVLCSSSRQTYDIARLAKQWRDPEVKDTLRIVSMNSSNADKQLAAILNGCDLLVSTPEPLLKAIEKNIIDSTNTRCLVIDEADLTLASHKETVLKIYMTFATNRKTNESKTIVQKNGIIKDKVMAFQTLVFAEKGSKDVQWFVKEVQHKPIVVFGSYYEASIALGIECKIEVISEERERDANVLSLINKVLAKKQKIAVVFGNENEIKFFKKLVKKCFNPLVVTHNTQHFDLESMANQWKRGANTVLFILDTSIKSIPGFKSCDCVIHYRLPSDFNDFNDVIGNRFLLMRDRLKKYKEPFDRQNRQQLINYIVVSPEDNKQIPELIAYLRRLKVSVPKQLMNLCQYKRRRLCNNYSSFGKCPFDSFKCFERHSFNEFDKPNPRVPKSGQIKIVISYVVSANQFFFRLNEFRGETHTSGKWQRMDITYDDIRQELNSLKDSDFNTIEKFSNEEVYGIAIRGQVFRVRLTQIFGYEELYSYEEYDPNDKSQKIELFCIDFGHKVRSRSRQLFQLPQHLKHLPSFAFKAHLFGIKPIDNEIEWDFNAKQKLYELVDNYRVIQTTAWILKQIDGVFWINRLNVQTKLKNAKLKLESNPIEYMIGHKLVERNDKKMSNFNTDYNRIVNIWQNNRLIETSYNACLVDESTHVVVSDFVSVEEIYLVHESRVKRLQELENKWKTSLDSLKPLLEVTEQQICFYEYFDSVYSEKYINRAKVVAINGESVDLFLVDHGETVPNVSKKCLLKIQERQLKELPFQAIRVSLFGFKALKRITYDQICELTRNTEDQYLMTIAEIVKQENGVNIVRLFVARDQNETQFTALSKLLVDLNYGQYIDCEEDNELEVFIDKGFDEESDEMPEYLERLEEEMSDNLCKDFILRTFNLKEDEDIDEEVKNRPKESRISKTLRRLKAIKDNTRRQQNTDSDQSEDESKSETKQYIQYSPEDFNYSYDPNGIACYDAEDDRDSLNSDEDAIFEEEDIS